VADSTPPTLTVNLVLFGRALRRRGIPVSTRQLMDLLRALRWVEVSNRRDFYDASRCALISRPEQRETFRLVFDWFWSAFVSTAGSARTRTQREAAGRALPAPVIEDVADIVESGDTSGAAVGAGADSYSWAEVLRRKDLAELSGEEWSHFRQVVSRMALELDRRRSRRFKRGSGPRPDVRATLRQSFHSAGEWMRWQRRKRIDVDRPLVVLADISGSMERYSLALLHFVYAAVRGYRGGAEVFVFGTRLTRITQELRRRRLPDAMAKVAGTVPDWSGGTRIGRSLHTFNTRWARRVLGRGAIVLLISDGWDRGEPAVLATEMARLQRTAGHLIWLNPLLGTRGYRPLTSGMQAALPYVDAFMPANNLASLERLAEGLRHLRRGAIRVPDSTPTAIRSRGGLGR
jgi:uncharacterized protein with von Willebrand factor type A (vWA) domain